MPVVHSKMPTERRYSEDDIPGVRVNDANKQRLSDLRLIQSPFSLPLRLCRVMMILGQMPKKRKKPETGIKSGSLVRPIESYEG